MKKVALIMALLGLNIAFAADTANNQSNQEYIEEYDEEYEEYENNIANANDNTNNIQQRKGGDSTDITYWEYTQEELDQKAAQKAKKEQKEREIKNLTLARKRSGAFIGLGFGYAPSAIIGEENILITNVTKIRIFGAGAALFAGYQHAFNNYAGIRAYGEVDYNLGTGIFYYRLQGEKSQSGRNSLLKAIGNLDFYVEGDMGRDKTETLGAFFGLGGAYTYFKNKGGDYLDFRMVSLVVNFGLHTIINNHHKIELFNRVYPFITATKTGNKLDAKFWETADIMLRYSYMF